MTAKPCTNSTYQLAAKPWRRPRLLCLRSESSKTAGPESTSPRPPPFDSARLGRFSNHASRKITHIAWTPCNRVKVQRQNASKTNVIWQIERIARSDAKGFKLEVVQGPKGRHFSGCSPAG